LDAKFPNKAIFNRGTIMIKVVIPNDQTVSQLN
jgi:hypothetical protein